MKKHDELVEEIRKEHCKKCFFSNPRAKWMCDASIEICREQIRWDITLTLSAVRDGRLALPGETMRQVVDSRLRLAIYPWMFTEEGDYLIGLRIEGTGKEEE